jgi:peptidoglycan/xylan/chitin deacetylase (PgdA/CDA1 family)
MPVDSIALFIDSDAPHAHEIRYTAELLLLTLGARHRTIQTLDESASYGATLAYARDPIAAAQSGVRVVAVGMSPLAPAFFSDTDPYPSSVISTIQHQEHAIPVMFCDEPIAHDAAGWITAVQETGSVAIPVDFLSSAFWFLSHWEEARSASRDAWGRFRYVDSVFARDPRFSMTIVDQYLALLCDLLHNALAAGDRRSCWLPRWPDAAPFAFCGTHDIDSLSKWHLRRALGEVGRLRQTWRTSGLSGVAQRVCSVASQLIHDPNPYDNVLKLAEQERARGVTATYFFLAGRRHPHDARYDLSRDESVGALIRQVEALGHEVGLHGSYTTFGDAQRLDEELRTLRQYAEKSVGQRQHYLRFDSMLSWPAYAAVGIEYDSSMGFADQVGSRAGFSFPMFPYDVRRRAVYPFVEIPLLVMDATLHAYRRLEADMAWAATRDVLQSVADCGGCFTMLWHNASFDDLDMPGYGDIYWQALEWAQERGAWIAPLADVSRWWMQRAQQTGAHREIRPSAW